METIRLKDPLSHEDMVLQIAAEEYNQQQAWRVSFQNGKTTLLGLDQHRIWKQFDGTPLGSALTSSIGRAIEEKQNYST